jgi:hypothetical protein
LVVTNRVLCNVKCVRITRGDAIEPRSAEELLEALSDKESGSNLAGTSVSEVAKARATKVMRCRVVRLVVRIRGLHFLVEYNVPSADWDPDRESKS